MAVQRLNSYERDRIYEAVLSRVRVAVENSIKEGSLPVDASISCQCPEFAWTGLEVLKQWPGLANRRFLIQAGSASWPRIRPEQDDGVSPTHMSYVYEARVARQHLLAALMADELSLPEVHVWLVSLDAYSNDVSSAEIIDFTTGTWPEACKQTIGFDWPGDLPPKYLWANLSKLPERVRYLPDQHATRLILAILDARERDRLAGG